MTMNDAEIFGFIRAVERYLADMAERGDYAAAILCGDAGIILAQYGEEQANGLSQ
jgi:hypothetical protein